LTTFDVAKRETIPMVVYTIFALLFVSFHHVVLLLLYTIVGDYKAVVRDFVGVVSKTWLW